MHCVRCCFIRLFQSRTILRCRSLGRVLFGRHLLFTNVGISMSLSALGDVIQQQYEIVQDTRKQWDRTRTYHMTVSGLTVGILCHHTYLYLDILFPGRTLKTVLKKVLVDQIVCSPMYIGLFFVTLAVLEKSNIDTFKEEVKQKSWRLYFAEWLVWPPAQIVNFYFVPLRFRVLYDNIISLVFDIYTSYVIYGIPLKKKD